ncbi:MAG: AMP-binding protein [Rhodoferax sp.]|nr:AMP-binding protein [Rhodoferax sp.]
MTDPWAGVGTVDKVLELRAAETPHAVAFREEACTGRWNSVSWHDFSMRVAKCSCALYAAGLRKGDRLALITPVSLEWELLHYAALAMGAVVVGLDAHDLPERIAIMAEQAEIVAFAISDLRVLSQINADRLAGCRFLLDLGDPQSGGDRPPGIRVLTLPELDAVGASTKRVPEPPTTDDIATIIFTSGTTGAPKGIAYSHGQVCLAIDAISNAFHIVGHNSRLLCWLPLSNLFQRIVNLAGMRSGAATYLLGDPRRVMEVVAMVSPDIFVGVPRFYEKLYDGIRDNISALPPLRRRMVESAWDIGRRASRYRLAELAMPPQLALAHSIADRTVLKRIRSVMGKRLRCMVTGSAPMSQHLLEEFHALGWLVLEAYGLSENVLPMAMNRMDDFRFGTVGRPLPGNQIVAAQDGAIKVRGAGVFSGYLGEDEQPPLDVNGFYLTGDLGRFDADGFLSLTGRSGDVIKTSTGRRVAPAGVEAQLRGVSGIDQAVLFGAGRKCLVAICTCAVGLDETARACLKRALRDQASRIYEHERPTAILLIERPFSIELGELTTNLKVRRAVIETKYATRIADLYARIDELPRAHGDELTVVSCAE